MLDCLSTLYVFLPGNTLKKEVFSIFSLPNFILIIRIAYMCSKHKMGGENKPNVYICQYFQIHSLFKLFFKLQTET